MTQEAIETRGTVTRPTLTVDSTDLPLGHGLALLVDRLRLGPQVGVTLRHLPTPEDKAAGNLLIRGTHDQLDIFERALGVYQHSVAEGLSGRVLEARMNDFFALQARRYGLTS